jgi:hypothetical protein
MNLEGIAYTAPPNEKTPNGFRRWGFIFIKSRAWQ